MSAARTEPLAVPLAGMARSDDEVEGGDREEEDVGVKPNVSGQTICYKFESRETPDTA